MADALPFASLQVLLDRLDSPEVLAFLQGDNRRDLLSELKMNLVAVEEVLVDAEEKQITNPRVKSWVERLKHAAYDAEDLLDDIATEVLRRKAESDSQTTTTQERSFIFSGSHPFSQRVGTITERLEFLGREKNVLGLIGGGSQNLPPRRWPATSLVDESGLVGRDDDKERVVELLLSNHSSGNGFGVISLVGMGGIGKTTLAQLVYNDRRVERCFDLRAWVCVSEQFDLVGVTKAIAESIGCGTSDNLNQLQINLKERLSRKKFFIVLDDVWSEKYSDWDKLKTPFTAGQNGSKILVTTRSDKVALVMRAVRHPLKELSFEDCWSLFAKHAFENGDSSSHPKLEEIGKEIVKKCKGLPLAAKTLGAALYSEFRVEEWERLLNSEIWDLPNDEELLPALRLSYSFLSPQLKRCFAYCSIFPKDCEIDKEDLILLWMAEGLLQQSQGNRTTMEKVGDEYFNVLLSRSFFQKYEVYESHFVMHDLMHDLARHISGKFFHHLNVASTNGVHPDRLRHLSFCGIGFDPFRRFGTFSNVNGLRTFLSSTSHPVFEESVQLSKSPPFSVPGLMSWGSGVPESFLQRTQYLRVLSLSYYGKVDLPMTIGDDLKHLRYIDLSYTDIAKLPDSICNLHNLQTLRLESCGYLRELPATMHRLISLRHLYIRNSGLEKMPGRMGELKNLQKLTLYIVGSKEDGTGVGELKGLSQIGGCLEIADLQNVVDGEDALKANLIGKQYLDNLCLNWDSPYNVDQNEAGIVLNNLRPHSNLKRLTIHGYVGFSFPNWLGRGGPTAMINMVSLCLWNCNNVSTFPPLGQLPSLKHLFMHYLGEIESVGCEFYGTGPCFPYLEELSIRYMPKWKTWLGLEGQSGVSFPRLKRLYIESCPMLTKVLPFVHMPLLRKLKIKACEQLVVRLTRVPAIRELTIGSYNIIQWKELPLPLQLLEISDFGYVHPSIFEEAHDSHYSKYLTEEENQDSEHFGSSMEVEIRDSESFESPMEVEIQDFDSWGSLLEEGILQSNTTCLQKFRISDCYFSRPLRRVCLPVTLKSLEFYSVTNLEFLLRELFKCYFPVLEQFKIAGGSCNSLSCFIISIFPRLTHLSICDIKGLESISFAISERDPPSYFQDLQINGCSDILSMELPPLNFSSCEISRCGNLETLLPNAACIQSFSISDCPKLKFPEKSVPSNLTSLSVRRCKTFTSQMEWALLPSTLTDLTMENSECEWLKVLPKEGPLLSTLTSLKILGIPNLKSLDSKGLPLLTSLRDLHVGYCPYLQSLTEERLPISLQNLEVRYCPNLRSLTEERLPTSLASLTITNCPLLKNRYQGGEDWHHISHIQHIVIDGQHLKRQVI